MGVLIAPDWWFRPSSNASGIFGVFLFLLGLGSVWTGKAPGRGGVTYRSKDPKTFWFVVVLYALGAAWFIGTFLANGR